MKKSIKNWLTLASKTSFSQDKKPNSIVQKNFITSKDILNYLKNVKKAKVSDIAKNFGVSKITIRKHADKLQKRNLIVKNFIKEEKVRKLLYEIVE